MKRRYEAFDEWFIEDERKIIIDCLWAIGKHVYTANSIYPVYMEKLIERRVHQDLAVGQCYRLAQELQYAALNGKIDYLAMMADTDMEE